MIIFYWDFNFIHVLTLLKSSITNRDIAAMSLVSTFTSFTSITFSWYQGVLNAGLYPEMNGFAFCYWNLFYIFYFLLFIYLNWKCKLNRVYYKCNEYYALLLKDLYSINLTGLHCAVP